MSWLSKALGLDKRPDLLAVINAELRDLAAAAGVRAVKHNLNALVKTNNSLALAQVILQRLADVPKASDPNLAFEALIADLRQAARLK